MKLIVGLGNPGRDYAESRHNIGFSVAKALIKERGFVLKKDNGTFSLSAKGRICGQVVIVALPLTYMNLSGNAVAALVRKYKIEPVDLLVIMDDLDLEFGRIKIRPSGSSGGHRGAESIIESLGIQEFARLRVGIGRPHQKADAAEFVLSEFTKKEKALFKEEIDTAVECCEYWAAKGIVETMNKFNRKDEK
ncbi:MAG: aminoacyl-tRNA hydrolase [Candidatus Omnitrophica bacterium]|nr:aminoacyl-tRNA hydrolase [Candidatus Omnitrophota bacterium]MBU1868935.1 aminoacyl-tRNA hydrolase [Candidatus Omnitrophota bacterium]